MGNPFLGAIGGTQAQGGPMNMMQAFQQFMQQNQGKNPNDILNQMLTSGKINQSQLNQAQQIAQKMAGQFNGMKSMFGFK